MTLNSTGTIALGAMIAAAAWLFAAPAPAQDQAAQGEQLFRTRCGSCHTVQAGVNRVGPSLAGVIGRKAGSVAGVRYSRALQSSDITWDAHALDEYLAAPSRRVPGTTMAIAVPNAEQRSAIIAYLARAGGGAPPSP
jgi:cytochrome c